MQRAGRIGFGVVGAVLAAFAFVPQASGQMARPIAADDRDATLLATAAQLREKALEGADPAYDLLSDLTTRIGPRPAGSPAMRRAAQWAVDRLTALGFDNVHTEPFKVDLWTRGEETAEIVAPSPQRLLVTALGGSVATPRDGVTADVALFESYDDMLAIRPGGLAGKIAVVTQPMPLGGYAAYFRIRGQGAAEAAKRGAVAYLMRSIGTDGRRTPHTGLMRYEGEDGKALPPSLRIPAAAVSAVDAEQLERLGRIGQPVRLHLRLTPSVLPSQTTETVVGEIRGSRHPEEVVLIGGHLDSWDLGTGALDDAAGVAITMAAAKLIAGLPTRPGRTIRVVLFGAEEIGKANAAYAEAHPAAEQARIELASECDLGAGHMFGVQLPRGTQGTAFARLLSRALGPLGTFVSPEPATEGGADLEALSGVPLASLQQDPSRYFDFHHTAEDTLDKVRIAEFRQNVAAWAIVTYLAADTDWSFRRAQQHPTREGAR